jgi:YidC/Oxa1 family membrane protein insertase
MNGGTAAGNGTSAGQMKFMMYGMPVIFFFIFYNAPSGLLLYWTVSNLIQMGQQLIINKIMAQKKTEIAAQKNEKTAAIAKKQGKK